jgi:TrmH family RNA methyltransferase
LLCEGDILNKSIKIYSISSLQNPHIKEIVRLRNRRHRDETKQYLIEGYRELTRALDNKIPLKSFYYCPEFFLGENERSLMQMAYDQGAEVYELSKPPFQKVSYRDRPDGLIAIAYQTPSYMEELSLILKGKANPFLLTVEAIEKPGNLGSMIRSGDGAGVDAIIVCDQATDIYNPNVIRSSIGTCFSVPIIQANGSDVIATLQQLTIPIIAASPNAKEIYTEVNYRQAVAFVVGREQIGLSKLWMKQADYLIRIPMKGSADSLNVSSATTLLLYEALRQRS